ncbi:TetR/AcrR family transcriptional regulator [Staphylococcus sp. IVB6240]|uniref:TetR/AcrR family transcriptional regulator n=1 Tax=Staphylococcus sp. IVB6240 TaxID=2989771 RepID=UPI0021D006E3|nr:TetR/AcrR family transcriptional regulator [Staphylococcus sp. IVB6240]UXR71055.1 TetR/AcrR family transcriptional regulator [Staphylococcus sp. IVB6240]
MDKRFLKNEKQIKQAILTLLQYKKFPTISVKEICELAECSRNTFYLHYDSKEHLLDTIINEIVESIEESCEPVVKDYRQIGRAESKKYTDNILSAIYEHQSVIKILLSQEQWYFSQRLVEVLLDASTREAKRLKHPINPSFLVFFMNGVIGYVLHWLQQDISLEEAQEELDNAIHFKF